MTLFLTVLHVMVCLVLIAVVLVQRGKGAEMGAVFGGGASSTVFGSRGAGNFLTKLTTACAIIFMITSLTLAYMGTDSSTSSLFDESIPGEVPAAETVTPTEPDAAGEGESLGGFEEVAPPVTPESSAPDEAARLGAGDPAPEPIPEAPTNP